MEKEYAKLVYIVRTLYSRASFNHKHKYEKHLHKLFASILFECTINRIQLIFIYVQRFSCDLSAAFVQKGLALGLDVDLYRPLHRRMLAVCL